MKKLSALILTFAFTIVLAAPTTSSAVPPPDEVPFEDCGIGADGAAQVTCDAEVPNDDVPGETCALVEVHTWKIRNLDGSITVWTLCDYGECGVEKPQG